MEKEKKCSHFWGWQEKRRFRKYNAIDEIWGGRCPKCKSKFAVELLENSKICPHCKVKLESTWEIYSEIYCPICKEEKIYQGVLK